MCYNTRFSHIYVERRIRNHPRTEQILLRFPQAQIVEIEHYKDVFNRHGQDGVRQHQAQALILAEKTDHFFYEGAPVCQDFGNTNFYYCSTMMNCIYDCSYCYLKGMYPSGHMVLFVNIEDYLEELDHILKTQNMYVCISYDADLLAMEAVTGYVRLWSAYAAKHENLKLEIRTKCAGHAMWDLPCLSNVIYAFTLSPQKMIDAFEKETPSAFARIVCAAEGLKKGFPVRLCFDPMLYLPSWKTDYLQLLSQIDRIFGDRMLHDGWEKLVDVSVGTFRLEDSRTTVDNYLRKDKSITESTGHNRQGNDNLVANAFLEWKMDSVTTLIFRPQYRTAVNDRGSSGFQQGWGNDVLLNERKSSGTTHSSSYNMTMMLQLSRKLSRMGRNIALKVDYGTNASSTDRTNLSTTHYFKNNTKNVKNQRIEDKVDGYNYRLQLVYVEPLPWLHFLQFRYSYQHRINNSDRFVYNWDKKTEEFAPDYDEDASNCFENQYSNHLFNLAIRTSRKKYNYNIGADFEPQKSVSHSLLEKKESLEEPLEKSVFNVSPTVNFRYKFSKRTRLQIVYRGKSRQPNIRDLQPITDRTNPLNIRVGNPSLKPSYTNTFTLNFNSYNAKHQRNMVASVLAENTINSVTNQVTYDSESGVRTTTPLNMNGNWRIMGSFSLNTPFKNRNWRFRTYSYLQYRNQNGYSTINKEAPVKSTVKHLTARQRLQLTYRTKKMEISARAELLYNNSYNNVKETRTETYDYRFGTEIQYYFPWNIELFSDLTYFQRSGYGYSGYARENLMWNCQLSKAFLKRKQILLRFKIYDILRQDVSMIRTITATAIRDTDYNALGSYFMVHAILRLNMMGH